MTSKNKRRVVFINLHGNEFLVKTINKILFGQSVAIKHGYFLRYLLEREDIEVCTYITKRGLSLSYTTTNPILQSFRFLEHKFIMSKNMIDRKKVTVLSKESEIRPDDILISYSYYAPTQLNFDKLPDAVRIICQIHFNTQESELEQWFCPNAMYNESNLRKFSGMWRRDLPWYDQKFITIPFVYEDRFKKSVPFKERQNKAVSVGTITYMTNISEYYGDACAQPARRNCRRLAEIRPDLIDSFNFDYLEGTNSGQSKYANLPILSTLSRLKAKATNGHQKKYYSFNMVDKLNSYKIAVVGEEIMGIPGIGFVEAMACGCAYIGQNVGYYEDYGMVEGKHYIGYDGSNEDLIEKIEYWQRPENQQRLETIANAGYEYVCHNFNNEVVAEKLLDSLLSLK